MAKEVTWWQKLVNAAQIASAVVAVFGFGAILLQINELRLNGRANAARQTYLGYMDLAFRNPSFVVPELERIKAGGPDQLTRYEVFVSYFLYSCEEAVAVLQKKTEWRDECELDLKPHLAFLCEKLKAEPEYLSTYSAAIQDLVRAGMQRYGVASPECKVKKA